MVSLRSAANSHFCGGWIHNTRWIVTAAHCTIGRAIANTVTVVGSRNLGSGGVTHTTASIVNHPNYNANTLLNDVALIWTSEMIVRTPSVQPIPLSTADTGSGTFAVVTGWGLNAVSFSKEWLDIDCTNSFTFQNPGYHPDIMQWLQKSTISNTACRNRHSLGDRSSINSSNLCTDNQNGMGTCTGDNGGPLVAGAAVIGIFSWSVPCARGLPDVYTRVSSYVTWIRTIAGNHE